MVRMKMQDMTEFIWLAAEQVAISHIGLSRQYHQFYPNQTRTKSRRLFRAGGEILVTVSQIRKTIKIVRKLNFCVSQQMEVKGEGQTNYSLML